jgi:hypothetical protein
MLRLHLDADYLAKQFRIRRLEAFRSERFRDSVLAQILVAAHIIVQPTLDVSYLVAVLLLSVQDQLSLAAMFVAAAANHCYWPASTGVDAPSTCWLCISRRSDQTMRKP